jgi:peptidoglycan/LPS O-acetylase OafA/YrhL
MSSPDDNRFRRHFANLREEDRSAAPPFARIAAAAPASSRRGSFVRIALAATPLLAIAVMFALRTHRSPDAIPGELTAWSSPTAFLLVTPGKQLLNQTPRLGEPLIQPLPAPQDGSK